LRLRMKSDDGRDLMEIQRDLMSELANSLSSRMPAIATVQNTVQNGSRESTFVAMRQSGVVILSDISMAERREVLEELLLNVRRTAAGVVVRGVAPRESTSSSAETRSVTVASEPGIPPSTSYRWNIGNVGLAASMVQRRRAERNRRNSTTQALLNDIRSQRFVFE